MRTPTTRDTAPDPLPAVVARAQNLLNVQVDGLGLWTEQEQAEVGDVVEDLLTHVAALQAERDKAVLHRKAAESRVRAQRAQSEKDRLAAESTVRALREAIAAFMTKWPAAEKQINSAFVLSMIHGGQYTGPSLAPELERFATVLTETP